VHVRRFGRHPNIVRFRIHVRPRSAKLVMPGRAEIVGSAVAKNWISPALPDG
jgi:hypothetical protein